MEVDKLPPDKGNTNSISLSEQRESSLDPLLHQDEPENLKRKRPIDIEETICPKKTIINPDQASASIDTVYTHPTLTDEKLYCKEDKAPFIVHIFRSSPDLTLGDSIRPIKFGQFLTRNNVRNITADGIKRIGRNRISVEFKSQDDANAFIKNPALSNNDYKAVIPSYQVTRIGIIRDVPVEWSMTELVEYIQVPVGYGHILKARRIRKRKVVDGSVTHINIPCVVLTFSGQVLPPRVFCFNNSLPVDTYNLPTIQCNNCCRFGHVQSQCRSKSRCFRCGEDHAGSSCQVSEALSVCLLCSGNHYANSKDCPELGRQKAIKIMMSQESISFSEAANRCPPIRRKYANAAKVVMAPSPHYPSSSKQETLASITAPNSPPRSYRKTVFQPPRPPPQLQKGYDVAAHRAAVGNYDPPPPPDGCALSNINTESSNENLIDILLSLLINVLSKFNDISLPAHVAQKLHSLKAFTFNHESNSPVEF